MAGFDGAARATDARSADPFDLVVLGAGSGGYACALRAAQLGSRVVLVEKDKVGGTCLHRGCIPTKAMLHAAEVADSVRNGSQFGVHAAIDKIDLAGVVSYADSVVGRIYKGLSGLVSSRGITVVQCGFAESARRTPGRRRRQPAVSRAQSGAGHRLVRPLAAWTGDRWPEAADE
jgi:pyruvate/2-oxoglutarate dehydrogenase complex dihydrolipoamide dehydrogenase (E3) component